MFSSLIVLKRNPSAFVLGLRGAEGNRGGWGDGMEVRGL